jgi:pimeloyl-ACP methyl ester carboxylesterase
MRVMRTRDIQANGLTFMCRESGPDDGEPVVLLHGFPETSIMWTGLTEELASAGYHCIAPNQRGYSPGARPPDAESYNFANIGADVHEIAKAAGFDRFHLIGHDWGAGAGWCALSIDESPIKTWTALSVGHPKTFAEAIRDDPDEELYRGFITFFLDPSTAAELSANDCEAMKSAGVWAAASPEEVADYVSVFRDPDALQAALNWYVASRGFARLFDDDRLLDFGPVFAPTLFLWGKDDPFIRTRAVRGTADQMTGPYRFVELDAGHSLIQEQYDTVLAEILSHLKDSRTDPSSI